MPSSTLLPCLDGIVIDHIAATGDAIVLRLSTVAPAVVCPLCRKHTSRVHSRYPRTIADLPWNRVAVRIHLRSRKFFCDNPACKRAIFTEPLPELVARYARKTCRLQEAFSLIGYLLGGKAGARLAAGLGLSAGPDALLRRVRRMAQENHTSSTGVRFVGVDDWAFRKGHRYGTVLVDLEQHRLLDLLPDRSSESLKNWLQQHPRLEIVSRDRAGVYADGTRQGAPQAQQVADRWHLLDNLGQAMQRLTAQHAPLLRRVAEQIAAATVVSPSASAPQPREGVEPKGLPRSEQRRLERCVQREACYNQVKTLRQQGLTVDTIASQVDVSKRTVQRFLQAQQFPARARRRQPRQTDRYQTYLKQRLEAGCQNATQLFRELQEQGYRGAYSSVYQAVQRLLSVKPNPARNAHGRASPSAEIPSSRSVAWWLQGHFNTSQPEVAQQQQAFVEHLFQEAPVLQEAAELAQAFARMVKKRQGADLDAWLETVAQSSCHDLRLFAAGLRQDLLAVRNGLTLRWSNGQVEGQVNRLKMLKRQMYGRANFDLLRARVLPMALAA